MKNKMRSHIKKWSSGISSTTNHSYEKYLKVGLDIISPHLTVRTYKTAPKNEYNIFTRGNDLRVQIYWKKESKYEFIIDAPFWTQNNTNSPDRKWMRQHADIHLQKIYDAVERGKKK